jgi:ATP-binding cassette subfamily B protein/ATP-binding cassette subfamily C protein
MRVSLQQYWFLLVGYLRPQQGRVISLGLLLFANIGLQLVNPQIMRNYLDAALGGGTLETLTEMAIVFIVIAIIQQVVAVGVTYLSENVSWTATNWLRFDLAKHCLYLDMSFHNEHTPGEMIERIDGDINALSNFFSQFTLQILGNSILLVGVLILLFLENITVGIAIGIFVVVTLLVINKLRNIAVPHWKESREASAVFYSYLEERIAGTEDIRASGAKSYVMRGFFLKLRRFWETTVKARLMAFALVNITWILFSIGTATAFIVGAILFRNGVLTLGTVYLITHYTGMLSRPIERISQEIERLQEAGAGVARIQEFLRIDRVLKDVTIGYERHLPSGSLSVSFENVSFAYQDSDAGDQPELVLKDISFQLKPGRVMGLLGRTGSGKTTMTRLFFRLYDPQDGQVRLGHTDVRDVHLDVLRRRVGIVTQNVQLFHASIRDNLTFFDPEVPDDEILAVIHQLGLTRWFDGLEKGLDTVLAAEGSDLSAGEAQLLALTRIFLKDPGLIILDEASSRLDLATEQLLEGAIERLLENRTGIIIAHRLGTVQRADEIMILENGRILEHGERLLLADDPGSQFYHLLQTGMEEVLA